MFILLGLALIILTSILGNLFWQCIKAKRFMKRILCDPKSLSTFVLDLYKAGYYSKKAEEASQRGGNWNRLLSKGAGYDAVIFLEAKSSADAFDGPRNKISAYILALGALSLFYLPYSVIVLLIFIITYFIPMSEAAIGRVNQELSAMSWLLYQFNRANPTGCDRFVKQVSLLSPLHTSVSQLTLQGGPQSAEGRRSI